jgi:hypothetical protein
MITPYYPDTNLGRGQWWTNMRDNAPSVLTSLGAAPALISKVNADSIGGVFLYVTLPAVYDKLGAKITGYIKTYLYDPDGTPAPVFPTIPPMPSLGVPTVLAGIEERREKWVQEIKGLAGYDPLIQGVTLRIEQTGTPFNPATYKGEITKLESNAPHTVTAGFRKASGNIQGGKFLGRKIGTATLYAFPDVRTVSPATLEVPLTTPGVAEEWEIQFQPYLKDQAVGIVSDFATVLVRG